MAAQAGKDLLLKVKDTTTFETVGGFRSNNFTINDESVEVTNKDSDRVRTLLEKAGIRSVSASGDGVFVNDTIFARVNGYILNGDHKEWQVIVPGLGSYEGVFALTSLDMSGEHNGEVTYSLSLDSAGAVTFTPET